VLRHKPPNPIYVEELLFEVFDAISACIRCRAFVKGGSFFFTLVTERRRPIFAADKAVNVLRSAFRSVRNSRPFTLDAIVVLPDHLHCIWTLPFDDADFATRWRLIKTWFTKHCDPGLRVKPSGVQSRRQEQALWQSLLGTLVA
jgi:putative transposase